jgi:hypothetical protein
MMMDNYKVKSLAERLGCWEEVANLSEIQAIRYLQRKEGYTACYAGDQPLVSTSYGDKIFCEVKDCVWTVDCNMFRLPNKISSGQGTASREDILVQADRYDCVEIVRSLPEVEAIRTIQQHGGFTPCYANEKPLRPTSEDSLACGVSACFWKQACDGFRTSQIIPLAKALTRVDIETLSQFRQKISELRAKLDNPAGRTIGFQLGSFDQIYPATKKMLLASPHTVMGELPNKANLKAYLLQDNSKTVAGLSSGYIFNYSFDILLTQDLGQLHNWFSETQPFIKSGSLDYFPLIHNIQYTKDVGRGAIYSHGAIPSYWTLDQDITLETFKAPYLGVSNGDIMLTRSEFAPILNLDLPVLENIDMHRLYQLMADHPNELSSFRDYLMDKMDDMNQSAVGSEQFGRDIAKIERDLRDQLRKLDSDLKKASLKTAVALSGSAIATWTLAIFCILKGHADLLTVLGPGGVLLPIGAAYSDYLVERLSLKDNPVFFLWEIGKTEKKK